MARVFIKLLCPLILNKEAKEIAVNLPQTLQPNQEYQWVLSLVCQPNERLQDQTIMGWIETTPVR